MMYYGSAEQLKNCLNHIVEDRRGTLTDKAIVAGALAYIEELEKDARPHVNNETGGCTTPAASEEVKKYMEGVIGVVEANSFETMCLWQQYHERRGWVSNGQGFGACVGSIGGKPVYISLNTSVVAGHRVLFIDPTSAVVDWELIDAWLLWNLPKTALNDQGRVNKTNAMNFHNVFPPEPRQEKPEGQDIACCHGLPADQCALVTSDKCRKHTSEGVTA